MAGKSNLFLANFPEKAPYFSCHVMHVVFASKENSSNIFKQKWIAMKCIEVYHFMHPGSEKNSPNETRNGEDSL